MIHFKDYETMPKFVEVMPRILQTFLRVRHSLHVKMPLNACDVPSPPSALWGAYSALPDPNWDTEKALGEIKGIM